MRIVVSAAASATQIDTDEPIADAKRLRKLDGLDYSKDRCSKYLDRSLQDIGIVGGLIRLAWDGQTQELRVVTEYRAPRKLTAAELKQLVQETTAQWSDGIGEGEFIHRKKLKVDVDLAPSKRGKVSAEQIDDGKAVRKPAVDPLVIAYRAGDHVEMQRLLAGFEDVNARITGGSTPFLLACACDLFDLALQMIQKGANVRVVDKSGLTPLVCVAHAGPRFGEKSSAARARMRFVVPLARALIERGAPVDGADKEGRTPLMWAVNRGNLPLVQLFINAGAQVNAQDRRKGHRFTVLNYAQRLDIVKVLLANGADPSKRNGYGMDAAEYAEMNDHLADSQRIADWLRSHRPKPDQKKPSGR